MASTASRRNLGRISEIAAAAVSHGFGYFSETHRLTDLLPGRPKLDPEAASPSERGRHLREMLDELGPTLVKFGQLFRSRAPPANRPAARPAEARPGGGQPLGTRPAPARDARRARPDVRQVRPAALHASPTG